MEAKDTVMEQFDKRHKRIAEAQAEVSFKAGMKESADQYEKWIQKTVIPESKKAGIREVVECVKEIDRADKKLPILNVDGTDYTVLLCKDWQAKLKEWGIDEK